MHVLAIDTALGACATALLNTNSGIRAAETVQLERGHAEALLPQIARVMDKAEMEFSSLDRIAVTVGPGSFTGLRVGLAAARGIALAAAKPVVGLSTLSALAAPHFASGNPGVVIALIDARHHQVYMQVFGGEGHTLVGPKVATLSEARQQIRTTPATLVGSGAALVFAVLPPEERAAVTVDARAAPDVEWVARLGAVSEIGRIPPKPLYLKAADARPLDPSRLLRRQP